MNAPGESPGHDNPRTLFQFLPRMPPEQRPGETPILSRFDSRGGKVHRQGPSSESIAALRATIAKQQTSVEGLEERVRVLERVVTDEAAKLGDEIERL